MRNKSFLHFHLREFDLFFCFHLWALWGGGARRLFLLLQEIHTLTLQKEVVSTHILSTLGEQLVLPVTVSCFLLPKEVAKWEIWLNKVMLQCTSTF